MLCFINHWCLLLNRFKVIKTVFKIDETTADIHEWINEKAFKSAMFHYWVIILEFQILILQFLQAEKERDFLLYVNMLKSVMKFFFSFNHYNYARWLCSRVDDLMTLQVAYSKIYQKFCCSKNSQSILVTCSGPSRWATQRNNKMGWWGCWVAFSRFGC